MTDYSRGSAAAYDSGPLDARSQKRIFFASFMTLIAAGIGFAVRGGILGDWQEQFGFTKTDVGVIFGAGLAGFGFTIIFFSFFADRFGYRALLLGAFVLHVLSAVVTLAATPIFDSMKDSDLPGAQRAVFQCLYWGM